MLVIVLDGIQECGLICPFVEAGFISPIVILLHLLCQESLNTFLCFHLLLILSIFAKHISQIFYPPPPQIFLRTDFGSTCKKSFEYAGNCAGGYIRMWLNLHVRYSWFVINIKFISPVILILLFYIKQHLL